MAGITRPSLPYTPPCTVNSINSIMGFIRDFFDPPDVFVHRFEVATDAAIHGTRSD
ncbi:MAG: hypothetical protein ACOYBP_09135 [Microbacteriaceae bacterium]